MAYVSGRDRRRRRLPREAAHTQSDASWILTKVGDPVAGRRPAEVAQRSGFHNELVSRPQADVVTPYGRHRAGGPHVRDPQAVWCAGCVRNVGGDDLVRTVDRQPVERAAGVDVHVPEPRRERGRPYGFERELRGADAGFERGPAQRVALDQKTRAFGRPAERVHRWSIENAAGEAGLVDDPHASGGAVRESGRERDPMAQRPRRSMERVSAA